MLLLGCAQWTLGTLVLNTVEYTESLNTLNTVAYYGSE